MPNQSPSIEEQIQAALDRPIPTAAYEPPSALGFDFQKTLERLGVRIDDPDSDALPRPIRIDFTYSCEMKGLPIGSTGKIVQSITRFIDDAVLASGVPALVRLFEGAVRLQGLSLKDVELTDVRLTRFVQVEPDE